MPFDGARCVHREYLQKMDKLIDLIGTPGRWGKGRFWTPDGRYCLRGAMREVDRSETLGPVILDAINEVTGRNYWRIESFNDNARTDHEQLVAVLIRARQNILAGRIVAQPSALTWCWRKIKGWFGQSNRLNNYHGGVTN